MRGRQGRGETVYAFSYLEMNSFCILLMLLVLRVHLRSLDKSASARVFSVLIGAMLTYTVFDLFCGLIENEFLPTAQWFSALLNVGFFWSGSLASYLSFVYGEHEMERPWITSARGKRLSAVPLGVTWVLTVLTLKFKFFFYIDEEGRYFKGPLYVPVMLCAYSYIALIGAVMLGLLRQKRYYAQRKKLLTLASFVVFPLLGGLFQSTHTGISVICAGGTVAIVQVFINMQETRITLDPLTRINNRTRLMQVLEASMNEKDRPLYLFLMDIDHFKEINDHYGHLEGDEALMALAKILMRVCGNFDGVLARYGGDEFVVVLLPAQKDEYLAPVEFRRMLIRELCTWNTHSAKPYHLNISIGCAKRDSKLDNIPDLIAAADEAMYLDKLKPKLNQNQL